MQLPETWPGILALLVLVCAMMGGVMTAFLRLTDKDISIDTGLLHGRAGVAGILLLLLVVLLGNETSPSITLALGLFMLTTIGGVALYFIIRRKGIMPKTIIFAHGTLAVAALAIFLFGLPLWK
jgi:drug/metabolite transporter (DMT)-like permease